MRQPLGERLTGPTIERLGWRAPLDGMRGVSVLCIMFVHFLHGFALHGGAIAVELFFVVSGFLITTLLLEEHARSQSVDLRAFYLRRAHRLFPALYTLLAGALIVAGIGLVFGGEEFRALSLELIGEVVAAALYVYNGLVVATGIEGRVLAHLWTLAGEEQFYLLWPLVLAWVLRRPARRIRPLVITMTAIIVGFIAIRLVLEPMVGGPATQGRSALDMIYRAGILRPDALLVGCLLAFVWRAMPRSAPGSTPDLRPWVDRLLLWAAGAELALLAVIVLFAFVEPGPSHSYVVPLLPRIPGISPFGGPLYQLAAVGLVFPILHVLRHPGDRLATLLSNDRIVAVGKRSYSLYLWHNLVNFAVTAFVTGLVPGHARLITLLALGPNLLLSFIAAELSYRLVEMPWLRRKRGIGTAPAERADDAAAGSGARR